MEIHHLKAIMSNESAKAFIRRMHSDDKFAKRVSALKDVQERMRLIKAEGFEFSRDELKGEERELKDELRHIEWW